MLRENSSAVVVKNALIPTTSGCISRIASTNRSPGTLMPRSITSNPAPSNITSQSFFPTSWMSPATVPMTNRPIVSTPAAAIKGRMIVMAPCMALAAISISGRNTSPVS